MEYEARLKEHLGASGWATRFKPVEHGSDKYWNDFLKGGASIGLDPDRLAQAQGGIPDEWLDHLVAGVHNQITNCWLMGSRYWEGELYTEQYGVQDVPGILRTGICAPPVCEDAQMIAEVIPRYFGHLLYGAGASFGPPQPGLASALELSVWEGMSLDFMVAGIGGCGTTSLRRNLGKHPEIGFTNNSLEADEDFFFFQSRRTLPLKKSVDSFNSFWGNSRGQRPRRLGLYNALMWREPAVRRILADIPHLRLVMIVCDPLGRFEKLFWQQSCKGASATPDPACLDRIGESLKPGLDNLLFGLELEEGAHFQMLTRLFGDRLLVVHQEALRDAPGKVYNQIAAFLGATKPFHPRHNFGRYNAVQGLRSGLCRNASLVKRLQRRMKGQYRVIGELLSMTGAPVSHEFLYRTRCDRPADLLPSALRCEKSRCRA